MPAPTDLLAATGIERSFGSSHILRGVDLAAGRGELRVVMGPNGAGKTTLLRILAGLTRPSGGAVLVEGKPLTGESGLRRRIGLLSHQSLLYDDLTPRENLRFLAGLYDLTDPDGAVTRALDAVGMSDRMDEPVRRLSRGMVQRVAIARALLHGPAILLLDEPFTGLDPRAAGQLVTLLASQLGAGSAIVLVTHSLGEIWPLVTRVSVLVAGRWVIDEPRPVDRDAFMPRLAAAFGD